MPHAPQPPAVPRTLTIASRRIADDTDCYVIAEIGHNHQGSMDTARQLLRAAHECGADAVKLQKRNNRSLYTRAEYDRPYDNENSFGATYGAHREALELDAAQWRELRDYAGELGLAFFGTAFDIESADLLAELDLPAFKVASGDLTNVPLLKHLAGLGRPLLISTGGGTLEDVERAYEAVVPHNSQIALLQCTSSYPCAFEEMNLRVVPVFRDRFPVVVGLSAHDSGIAMPLVAYALGARIVEKHFTLNRAMKGTDHAFSLERPGLQKLVRDLRRARVALGDGIKRPYPSEALPLRRMKKTLVAARALPRGTVLAASDIAVRSPEGGLLPYQLESIVGHRTRRALEPDDSLQLEDLEDAAR